MLYRKFGSAPSAVSLIGQGTWRIEKNERSEAIQALKRGIDLGMTHIDTAERYGFGVVEEIVAEADGWAAPGGFSGLEVLPDNAAPTNVLRSCENSLRRLKTDRLDCYLLHWRGEVPLIETIGAFEQLKQEGKILSWGVSNFDLPDLEEIASFADPKKIACNQILYHLEERRSEHTVVPWCREHGIAITAYSSFGHEGFPSLTTAAGRVLSDLAQDRGVSARQIALAFLARNHDIFFIPRSTNADHTEENCRSIEIVLTASELERLETAFPQGPRPEILPSI
ncbi:MAG: aldo/keto reductase [Rhizomicrobium sp.]